MTPTARLQRIRQDITRIEDASRSDEVAEACEALRDAAEALDTALAEEFGPRDEELDTVEKVAE